MQARFAILVRIAGVGEGSREAIYMPALVAIRFNTVMKAKYDGLPAAA